MKKYLIGMILLLISLAALTGCGQPPLQDACDDLNALTPAIETDGESSEEDADAAVSSGVRASYDEAKDQLVVGITPGADLDTLFETLNENIDGEEVGTMIFLLDGALGDGYENDLDQKISQLSCDSMERLGLNSHIMQAETHSWTRLSAKTDKLYFQGPPSVFRDYSDADLKQLEKFTDVAMAYEPAFQYQGIQLLTGAQTLTLVQPVEMPDGSASAKAGQGDDTEDAAETENADSEGDGDAPAFAPVEFTYDEAASRKVEEIANMKSLSTVLIYPDTGYTMDASGEKFIAILPCLKSDLTINPPDEAFTGENLVFASGVETPNVDEAAKEDLLAGFLKGKGKKIYQECSGYQAGAETPVLTGSCLIYKADPDTDDWENPAGFTSKGSVLLSEPAKQDIQVPSAINDYSTFVYVYPTYTKTGSYNTGTDAYRQTLHVQVFNMDRQVAYKAETVGTAEAPQKFSFYVGEMPDKKSGEVSMKEAYEYLNTLKKAKAR